MPLFLLVWLWSSTEKSDQQVKADPGISSCVQQLYMDSTANFQEEKQLWLTMILLRIAVDKWFG